MNLTRDNEGAIVPIIHRTDASMATMYSDRTNSLTSEAWRTEPCATLYVAEVRIDGLAGPASRVFSCTQLDGAVPA